MRKTAAVADKRMYFKPIDLDELTNKMKLLVTIICSRHDGKA